MPASPRRRADIVLIAVLLVAALAWLAVTQLPRTTGTSAVVVCQTRDGFYRADPLSSQVSYTVETPGTGRGADADGGVNNVRISNGTVWVESANCGNQVCVEHDPIGEPGQQIVCLPHGMVIEVVEREEDAARLS